MSEANRSPKRDWTTGGWGGSRPLKRDKYGVPLDDRARRRELVDATYRWQQRADVLRAELDARRMGVERPPEDVTDQQVLPEGEDG